MGSIDTALYTRLSGLISTRIYPAPIPQNATYPLVVYQQISGPRSYSMGVQSLIVRARFQLDSWAQTSLAVRSLAEQVRSALSNYHGTSDGVVIDHVELVNEQKLYEDEADLHRMIQDYMIDYRESAP